MSSQIELTRALDPVEGLRSRKKAKLRRMIEEAALELFAKQGYEATTVEQIAARVEISATTFFRYFPSKADAVLCQQNGRLPELRAAIMSRPAEEPDLAALRHAMWEVWVPNIDPETTRRAGLAVASSAALRGLYDDVNRRWVEAIATALAERKGRDAADADAMITARVAVDVFNDAVRAWRAGESEDAIGTLVDRGFAAFARLSGEWAKLGE